MNWGDVMKRFFVFILLLLLVGCSKNEVKNKPVTVNPIIENEVTITEIEEVIDTFEVEPLENKWGFNFNAVESWSINKPYFNPLGEEKDYLFIEFNPQTETYYSYIDDYAVRQSDLWYGDQTIMHIPFNEDFTLEENKQFMFDIETYIVSLNGEILGRDRNSLSFIVMEGMQHWYGTIEEIDDYFLVELCKENFIPNDTDFVINTSLYDENKAKFTSYNSGELFQTLVLNKDGGDVFLSVYMNHAYGDYKRSFTMSKDYYNDYGETFYINGLPSEEGPIEWIIEWSDETEEITLLLETNGLIDKIKHGEALGAIKVSAEYVGAIHAIPTGGYNLLIEHPNFYYETSSLDKTPDGDHILYLPSGYWDIVIEPQNKFLVESFKTKMIPVNSGQMTEVIIPNSISQSLKFSNTGVKNGLAIGAINEENQEVNFRFTLLDDATNEVLPMIENSIIYEGGIEAEILSLTPVTLPLDIVLLIDSSGSMKGELQDTLQAAKQFVENLPDDTRIVIVDFDTKVKAKDGKSKQEALKSIEQLTVGGATALYDAIDFGVESLRDLNRTAVVLFTDGQDANLNDTGPGSELDYETLMLKLGEDVPVYTIGFGQNHDKDTLENISEKTHGEYFSASDQNALTSIFDAINSKLSNTYDLVYKRPKVLGKSDFPVISIIIDTSGSMGSGYEDTGEYGDRLIKVKNLLHEFILRLPEDVSIQLSEFNDRTSIVQLNTLDRRHILKALAELEAGGYTDIEGSIQVSYETLNEIPSSKKVLVYITDAALGTRDAEENMLENLSEMKESAIDVLWIGMGIQEDDEEDFSLAAELSGGDYIISTDVNELKTKVDEVLNRIIHAEESKKTTISLTIEKEDALGEREAYSTSKLVMLSPSEVGEIASIDATTFKITEMVSTYDKESSTMVTGDSLHGKEVWITSRQKAEKSSVNEACEIMVHEIYTLDKLAGVEAPYGQQFVALNLSLKNILEAQEVMVYPDGSAHPASWVGGNAKGKLEKKKISYMIPNFVNHFYLSFNDNQVPGNTATWVTNSPIIKPGDYSLTIDPDTSSKGVMIFLAPKEAINQISLHLYDTNYGHINLPITGVMKSPFDLESLPLQAKENLADAFGLGINDVKRLKEFKDYKLDPLTSLIEVDGNFTSNMQALLDLNPRERISLELPTENGSYFIPISPMTVEIPGGFIQKTMVAPGAMNRVKWLFEIPNNLIDNKKNIVVDLQEEDKSVVVETGVLESSQLIRRLSFEYYDLDINDFILDERFLDSSSRMAILDITVHEKKDGFSTTGITDQLVLKTDEGGEDNVGLGNFASSGNQIFAGDEFNDYILELDNESVFLDGTSRRGFVFYPIYDDRTWYLSLSEDILEPRIGDLSDGYFGTHYTYYEDEFYMSMMQDAISYAVETYERSHPINEGLKHGMMSFDQVYDQVSPVSLTTYGFKLKDDIDNLDKLIQTLKSIKCVPSKYFYNGFSNINSTEAFLMQGYGTVQDFGQATKNILSGLGYSVKMHELRLTERGKEQLDKMVGFETNVELVPGLSFKDGDDYRMLIMPFMVFADEISDLAEVYDAALNEYEQAGIQIEIELEGLYTERGIQQNFADINDALGGEEGDQKVTTSIFYEKIPLEILSLECIDILIGNSGQSANVIVSTANGEYSGDSFNPNYYEIERYYISYYLNDGTKITQIVELNEVPFNQILISSSINQPNLNEVSGRYLKTKADEVYELIDHPDPLTTLKWLSRKSINDMIYHQSKFEKEMANDLNVLSYRTNLTRIISVVHKYHNGKLISSLDMLQPYSDVYGDPERIQSFNTMLGLMISDIEESILGFGLESIWANLPSDVEMVFLNLDDDNSEFIQNLDMSDTLKAYLIASDKHILISDKPALMNDEKRWAWLEFEQDYKVTSVLDDFTHGTAESAIIDAVKNSAQFALGAFKGVETSMWSVAAFSLEESDYTTILKNAKAFALGISKKFGYSMGGVGGSVGGTISASQSVGPVNVTFNGKPDISQNSLGFTEGFVEGVKIYFDSAK